MKEFQIPYGTAAMKLKVEEENLEGVLVSGAHSFQVTRSQEEIVREAISHPIGSKRLSELSKGKKRIAIVTSDHTRAVPSKITLPILLEEIRSANPQAEITILIATGMHRATTEEEQRRMFGDAIVDRERIVINDAFREEDFEDLGVLPSGAHFHVNKEVLACDLLVTEGFIEPHFFAGFSGGRKSILPGMCNKVTISENHSYRAIADVHSKTGVLEGNPIHRDMVEAARRVNVQYILNVLLNEKKEIIAAFAGDLEAAHGEGVVLLRSISQCRAIKGDIVVTSNGGYPLDQNLYQSPKAIATAESCAKEGAVIIMCCSCTDGMGGTHFAELIVKGTPEEIDGYLSNIPAKETIPEQWCAQIYSRILKKHKVILVTTYLDEETVRRCNMIPAADMDEAMKLAYEIKGRDARVVVIPDGVSVMAAEE
ncbi:nickel-dependent lactate racemase [Lacrimispora sp. 210928-DFI.3.58]|uniref:nickel-dependent lactate racemase n=1 Tax=Lacrimispora sp. 210928-DFI.3.58 TaxID=2883214 RepID=UPI001D05E6EE|nr:nickel-dependent lactate racemase [Lacrimispora sp. 210928-DFI.3.58]MCB7317437.1 nickel-dependent lactate racemase [Lacrimispora sp. 210928-DFI.3.58]